jgi:hypothetical protein
LATTFFDLRTQDEQIRYFGAVAQRLVEGGAFVLEAFVPDPALLAAGTRVSPRFVEAVDPIGFDLTTGTSLRRHVDFCNLPLSDGMFEPTRLRYAWSAELDRMAGLAGLSLAERYGDWDRKHVSVFRAPEVDEQRMLAAKNSAPAPPRQRCVVNVLRPRRRLVEAPAWSWWSRTRPSGVHPSLGQTGRVTGVRHIARIGSG